MLVVSEDKASHLLQADQDLYHGNTNFSDLPDLPSLASDEMSSRTFLTNLSKLNDVATKMQYDQKLQALLYRQKKMKVFKDGLSDFNKFKKGSKGSNMI